MVTVLRRVTPAAHGAVDPAALRAEGVAPVDVVDFSSNRSPLGSAPGVREAAAAAELDAYPDPRATDFCSAAAAFHGLPETCVVAGNGSTELIRLIAQLALRPGDVAVVMGPAFGEYAVATELAGATLVEVRLTHRGRGLGFRCDESALRSAIHVAKARLCWLCSPGNPTGTTLRDGFIAETAAGSPGTLVVLDEAYCDLLPAAQWTAATLAAGNVVVLRSMTKTWGLAGVRLGYALAAEDTAARLRAALPPWNVNACAQAAGRAAFAALGHHEAALRMLRDERDRLCCELRARGWTVEPSDAGFFLVHVGDAVAARSALLARGCLVRDCTSFGLPAYVRVSPRLPAQNDLLLEAFGALQAREVV